MSCPCGSSICDCRVECLCVQDQCQCNKCSLLPKICSRCNLPFYIIIHQKENVGSICSCKAQKHNLPSESHLQSRSSETCNEKAVTSYRKTQCPRCSLPIIIVTKSEDYHSFDSCCCSHKNSDSNTTGTTEHETSNCTSDHRDISGDRQARKTSRRTRTEKSSWQYKKTKGKHLADSDEDYSDTETLTSDEFLIENSTNRAEGNPELSVPCTGSVTSDSNFQNLNFDSNAQSPIGIFFRAGDNSIGDASLFANTSGFSSPSTFKDFLSPPESPGFFQLSQNVRPKLPPPFPVLPKPIPGLPAFRNCEGHDSQLQMKKSRSFHPSPIDQPALARSEKVEKWFETIESVLTTSGALPDAETAAVLDREDKEKIERQPKDNLDDQFERQPIEKYVDPFRSPKNSGRMPYLKPATNNPKNGKELDVIDPTTDTERSSTLSKSHKESESD